MAMHLTEYNNNILDTSDKIETSANPVLSAISKQQAIMEVDLDKHQTCFELTDLCHVVFLFQTRSLYLIVIGSLISVCILQFINDMILCSLALSFAISAVILMSFHVSSMHFFFS